jgi:hypothetical protein
LSDTDTIPVNRPRQIWIWASAAVIALSLLGMAAILSRTGPGQMLAAFLPQTDTPTPSPAGTATVTPPPDATATFEANATQFASWMATYVATTGVTPTPSPTFVPTPTPPPDLTATALAACVFDMAVVDNPPVRPSMLTPGQQFVKKWTIQNTGTCPWPAGVRLVFASGEEADVLKEPEIDSTAPGGTAVVEITLRAPQPYASYASVWQLQNPGGKPIGDSLEIEYRVGLTPTPRPITPTATSTPESPPTPTEPLHFSVPIVVSWENFDGKWRADVGLTAWGGTGEYRYYENYVSEETEFFNGTFEIESEKCRAWWGTVIVTSGDEESRWEGKIPYPEIEDCK